MSEKFHHVTEYYDEHGKNVATQITNEDMFGDLHTSVSVHREADPAVPTLLLIGIAVCVVINSIMCMLHAYAELLYIIGRVLMVVSIPVMLLIQRRVLRSGDDSRPAIRGIRRMETIFTALTFTMLAVLNYLAMEKDTVLTDYGYYVFLASFLPMVFHSVATMVYRIAACRRPEAHTIKRLSDRALTCVNVGGFFLIMTAQFLGTLRFAYEPTFKGSYVLVGGMIVLFVISLVIILVTRIPAAIGGIFIRE